MARIRGLELGNIMISWALGLVAAWLIVYLFKSRVELHGPRASTVGKYRFHDPISGKCYRFTTEVEPCPSYTKWMTIV
jgi:hypothetical protein